MADIRRVRGMRSPTPLPGSKFFQFHTVFWGKFGKIYVGDPLGGLVPHLGEILDPPLLLHVTDRIFKLRPIRASVIHQIS